MTNKVKQISYLSMIVLIIGSTVGAGIFYKNRDIAQLAHGNFLPVLATWGIAIFGILSLAFALIEISSAQKTDKGTLEWTKLFTPKWFHKSSTNYIKYIFIPLTLFTMPLYVVSTFQDAGWTINHGVTALVVAFGIFAWFMIINLVSFRFSEISQWVFTVIQTIPLIILPIIAYYHSGSVPVMHKTIGDDGIGSIPHGIHGASSWIALIAGISAISFAYDGFYVITSIKERTSNQDKMGIGMVLGVVVVSVIYLFLTIAFNVGSSSGTHYGIPGISDGLMKAMDVCIAIGIIGIVNGYSMSSPRQFRSLAEQGEAREIIWIHKLIYRGKYQKDDKKQMEIAGWTYLFALTTIYFILFGMIGIYGYKLNDYADSYGQVGTLYTLADALVNFTSLLIFIIITTCVLGGIVNRKTKNVDVKKHRYFLPMAWIAVVVFYAAGIFMIGASFLDTLNVTGDLTSEEITSSIIKFMIFVGILTISIAPGFIKLKISKS